MSFQLEREPEFEPDAPELRRGALAIRHLTGGSLPAGQPWFKASYQTATSSALDLDGIYDVVGPIGARALIDRVLIGDVIELKLEQL